jgi:hypothetical protein
MAKTAVPNSALITLQPTGAASPALNPLFVACDPTNGNSFVASGRDLLTFYCLPANQAPAWSSIVTYTAGRVVNFAGIEYIALTLTTNLNQNPSTAMTFWQVYTGSTLTLLSAPDACAGRKSDVLNYPVPDFTVSSPPVVSIGGTVQFQILPSSVFTQSDGSVQFIASSDLVQVNVSSL